MRVVTYNIRHGTPGDQRPDVGAVARVVASLDADVVALQEVDRWVGRSSFRDQARVVARAAGLDHLRAPARRLGWFGRYGNAVLHRGVLLRSRMLVLPGRGEPRAAAFCRLAVDGREVTVVATHLQHRGRGGVPQAPSQLDVVLEELARWPSPRVLMGDLNLGADEVLPRFAAAGLEAVDSGPTFPAHRPRRRIDWIGLDGLRPVAVRVPDHRVSDHRPLVADLE